MKLKVLEDNYVTIEPIVCEENQVLSNTIKNDTMSILELLTIMCKSNGVLSRNEEGLISSQGAFIDIDMFLTDNTMYVFTFGDHLLYFVDAADYEDATKIVGGWNGNCKEDKIIFSGKLIPIDIV